MTIASRHAVLRDGVNSVAMLLSKPGNTVFFGPEAGPAVPGPAKEAPGGKYAHVSIEDNWDSVLIHVRDSPGGTLVLRDAFYPGWRASVDGREVTVRKADFLFRGIHLEPGDHRVVFRYDPAPLHISRWVSLLAMLFLAGLALTPRRFHRRLPGYRHRE